jgi:hypothetical protein
MKSSRLRSIVLAAVLLLPAVVTPLTAAGIQPDQIDDLALWLTAGDLSPGHRDGQAVTLWPDRSGRGFDAVYEGRVPQAGMKTGIHNPPTYKHGALADQPVVAFDADNRQSLILNRAGHALGQQTSGFTAVFLVNPALEYGPAPASDAPWTTNRYLFLTHVSNYNTRVSVQIVEDTGEVQLYSRAVTAQEDGNDNSSFINGERHAVTGGAWHRLMVTVDYRAKVARIVIDGKVLEYALPSDTADAFEDIPSPIAGIASTTLGDWLTCQLAELICYQQALSVDELQALDRYLTGKYQLVP